MDSFIYPKNLVKYPLLKDCELYICGRSKDLIIIRGRNLYPQDIEYACHSLPEVKQGSIAAFSIAGEEEESLVVVLELREGNYDPSKYDAISKSLRSVISESNGISPKEIVFVAPKTIPKTTSGKISRSRCRDEYLKKSLQEVAHITFADTDVKEASSLPIDVQPMEIEATNGSRIPGEVDVLPTITESVHNPSESDTVNLPSQLDKVDTCALHGEELESTLLEDVCFLCGIQSYTVTISFNEVRESFTGVKHRFARDDESGFVETSSIEGHSGAVLWC